MEKDTNRVTQAEQYLLERIRIGNQQAWSDFVDRYRGRLMSFASTKLPQSADAEDAVQETFIAFIKNLHNYRLECTLETYLFSLLRRKIIDTYRSKKARFMCMIQDVYSSSYPEDSRSSDPFERMAGPSQTASWYCKADEQYQLQRDILTEALDELVDGLKKNLNFRDLQIIELLFYCQLTNRDIAKIINISENNIAIIKHRSLKQIHDRIAASDLPAGPSNEDFENLLTDIWALQRFSCPKRSTIGSFVLGTLDDNWRDYIDFHINKLGCRYCKANLDDLKTASEDRNQRLQVRIMESTAGFLKK